MDGLTILEVVTTAQEPNIIWAIVIMLIATFLGLFCFLVGLIFFKYDTKADTIIGSILLFGAFVCIFVVMGAEYIVPAEEIDLGYEQIVAYVDTSVMTEEQIKEKYEIISQNGEIYTLREKKKITEDVVQNENVHQWKVTDTCRKEDETEYIIECTECKQKKQVSN